MSNIVNRGMDLVDAIMSSPANSASLIYSGGDTKADIIREPPRTAHDSLYIARVIAARAGAQTPVVRSIQITSGGVAGDLDLTDTSSSTYGGGTTLDAAGSNALFAQVRANSSTYYQAGAFGVEVYGLLVELQAAQNVALPAIDFDVRGCAYGASSYNATAVGVDPGATWTFNNATNSNINISGSLGPPSGVADSPRQRIRFLVLPAVAYNGLYYYTPFVCRPTSAFTAFGPPPVTVPYANVAMPGRAVIHCRLNSGLAFPAGTTVNYQLLTRGCTDVDNLIRRYMANDRVLGKIAALSRSV